MKALHLLLAAAVGLSGALGALWLDPQQPGALRTFAWEPPAPLAPGFAVPQLPSALSGVVPPGTATYFAVLDRPLFAADRRLPPPPPPPGAKPAEPPPDPFASIQLLGVFSGEATTGAIMRVNGVLRRVKASEDVSGWTLKGVNGREVTFSRGEETKTLLLTYVKAPVASAPAAPTAGTPQAQAQQAVPAFDPEAEQQKRREEIRENIRKRNALRASAGLPPVFD